MSVKYLAIVDPQGVVIHTHIGLVEDEIIEGWLEEERSLNFIGNLGRASRSESLRCNPSWEAYEAQGYKIVPVQITPIL